MSDPDETWFDRWLDAPGHERLKLFYLTRWLTWEMRVRRFFSFRRRYQDWKFARQFRVGDFFLDHGSEPAVIYEIRDYAIYGVSMVNGKGCVSDMWNCGPETCTREAAWKLAEELRKAREVDDGQGL